jgi:hypothetical protein
MTHVQGIAATDHLHTVAKPAEVVTPDKAKA